MILEKIQKYYLLVDTHTKLLLVNQHTDIFENRPKIIFSKSSFTWLCCAVPGRAFPDGLQQTVFPRIPMGIPSAQQGRLQQTVFPWEYIPLRLQSLKKLCD